MPDESEKRITVLPAGGAPADLGGQIAYLTNEERDGRPVRVVMAPPANTVILIETEAKKKSEEPKKEKRHSEVFNRI